MTKTRLPLFELIQRPILHTIALVLLLPFATQFFVKYYNSPFIAVKGQDYIQDYLMARAIWNNDNPYRPISDLASRYGFANSESVLINPSPHPPILALIVFPFSFFPFEVACSCWFILELACLWFSFYLLFKIQNLKRAGVMASVVSLLALTSAPVVTELLNGQWGLILLLIVTISYWCFLKKKEMMCGILIGAAICIKLFLLPFLLFFLSKKKWKVMGSFFFTAGILNLVTGIVCKVHLASYNYRQAVSQSFQMYRQSFFNFSIWTLGWRIFEGTGFKSTNLKDCLPLIYHPQWAHPFSLLVVLSVFVLLFLPTLRSISLEKTYNIYIVLSLLCCPILWSHYLVLSLFPITMLMISFVQHKNTRGLEIICLITFLLAWLDEGMVKGIVGDIVLGMGSSGPPFVFWYSLFGMIPAILLCGLGALLIYSKSR